MSCVGLIIDVWPIASASAMFAIAQYVFIRQRWVSISRGCGAPGYVSYWLALAVLALEVAHSISTRATDWFCLALTLDLALIFFIAGLYKFASGYRRGHGVVLGLVNPEWSYAPKFWSRIPPRSPLFRLLDGYGWFGEVIGAVLLVLPWTRTIGAVILALMFLALIPLIRLGLLTLMVLAQCLLVVLSSTDPVGLRLKVAIGIGASSATSGTDSTLWVAPTAALGYLCILLVAYAGLVSNFYSGWRPPLVIQAVIDRIANVLGLVLWRVFTSDVTNFYIEIFERSPSGALVRMSRWTGLGIGRFQDVTEAICVTSIFTARRYYPERPNIFNTRLIRYARSLRHSTSSSALVFQYWALDPWASNERERVAASFTVDLGTWSVLEEVFSETDVSRRPADFSAIRPAEAPGTYRRAT